MSFEWLNYLTFSQYLLDNCDAIPEQEACYRTIVSRAYYAVYCSTREYIIQHFEYSSFGNDHQNLQTFLIRHQKPYSTIGNKLKQLHQLRKKADYDNQLNELPVNTAARALAQAQKIAEKLSELKTTKT